eukprot:3544916-Rhodomonas_salina.1
MKPRLCVRQLDTRMTSFSPPALRGVERGQEGHKSSVEGGIAEGGARGGSGMGKRDERYCGVVWKVREEHRGGRWVRRGGYTLERVHGGHLHTRREPSAGFALPREQLLDLCGLRFVETDDSDLLRVEPVAHEGVDQPHD